MVKVPLIIDPVGIDIPIQALQTKLAEKIGWGDNNYGSFGRAYVNMKEGKRTPEIYIGNNEYEDLYSLDILDGMSFFFVSSTIPKPTNQYKAAVSLIFQLNLDRLYPGLAHRADENAHNDVLSYLDKDPEEFRVTNVKTGLKEVYEDLDFDDPVKDDMQPYHYFRVDMEVLFDYSKCKLKQ